MPDSVFRPESDEEWNALLRQLRRPQAQPRPFFYARLQARLLPKNASAATTWLPAWLRRPAYAAVLGALVLAVSGDGAVAATTRSPSSYLVRPVPGSR